MQIKYFLQIVCSLGLYVYARNTHVNHRAGHRSTGITTQIHRIKKHIHLR